jgi:rod shape-determining protein MreB
MMADGTILIGMDLGTYKTSVASSCGTRDTFLSAVGWPKDQISRQMLGQDVVVGNDTVRHRLALDVVRPFEKGALKYNDQADAGLSQEMIDKHKEAARLVVEHAVELVGAPKGTPTYGIIGAPARATKLKKRILMEVAKGAFDAVFIVSEPFTIAYGLDLLTDTLVVDIGAGTIDLCPIFGTFPGEEYQVTLPLGGDFIDEHFYKTMRAEHPEIKMSLNMAREIKEKYGFVHDEGGRAVVTLPVHGKPKQCDVTDSLKNACNIIVAPIAEAITELVMRFDGEFQQRLLNNIILGGGGSQLRGLDRALEDALQQYSGGKVRQVSDAVFAGANGALKLAQMMPPESWREARYTVVEETAKIAA